MTAPSLLPHKNKKQVQQVTLPPIPSPNQQKQLQNISSRSRRQPLQLTHIYPVSQQTTATTDHPLPHNKTNPSIGLFYPTCLKQPVPTTSPNRNLFLCLPNNTVEATTHHLILRNENFTELSPTSQQQLNLPQHLTDIYPFSSDQQQIVDARGPNRTKIVIEGLSRGFRYAFTVQAYNEHGRSNHSLPAASVHMLGEYGWKGRVCLRGYECVWTRGRKG